MICLLFPPSRQFPADGDAASHKINAKRAGREWNFVHSLPAFCLQSCLTDAIIIILSAVL